MEVTKKRLPKVPSPPENLTWNEDDLRFYSGQVYRIYFPGGEHDNRWHTFRHVGPITGMRWDPQTKGSNDALGVMYGTFDLATALAEVFQDTRAINLTTRSPKVVKWTPSRTIRILKVHGSDWSLRMGGAHSINALEDVKLSCEWARAIVAADRKRELDGLQVQSTMTGKPMIVLFKRHTNFLPVSPDEHETLASDTLRPLIETLATKIGYDVFTA